MLYPFEQNKVLRFPKLGFTASLAAHQMHKHPPAGRDNKPSLGRMGVDTENPVESLSWPEREQGASWKVYPLDGRSQRENTLTGHKAQFSRCITR